MKKYFLISVMALFAACASSNKAAQSSESKSDSGTKSETVSESAGSDKELDQKKAERDINNTYRLVVSFYSIGSGSDAKAINQFETMLADYQVQHNLRIAFDKTPWGREGEVDYCVRLDNLKSDEQSNFILMTKEVLFQSQLVHITENALCKHLH